MPIPNDVSFLFVVDVVRGVNFRVKIQNDNDRNTAIFFANGNVIKFADFECCEAVAGIFWQSPNTIVLEDEKAVQKFMTIWREGL